MPLFLEPGLCGLERGCPAQPRGSFFQTDRQDSPGAVVLLHNTSKTNGEILDELLTKWEEMGYTFGKLEELVQ